MTTRFVVLGCGHTGTTLLSGIFHISGFESAQVNSLFESEPLLELDKRLLSGAGESVYAEFENFFHILEDKTKGRWCIKDPRLSLTIHKVYPLMPKPIKILYNFRDPRNTVKHLLKERERHCPDMTPSEAFADAENEYYERNKSILEFIDTHPEISYLTVNYDDLVDGKLRDVIDRFVGKRMNYTFIQPYKRKSPPIEVSHEIIALYKSIMDLYSRNLSTCILETKSFRPNRITALSNNLKYKEYLLLKRMCRSVEGKKKMLSNLPKRVKRYISDLFPGHFPRLYSTLDCKVQKVPVQVAAYSLVKDDYIRQGDRVLDVGFGLGYGLQIMAERAGDLTGIEVDRRAVVKGQDLLLENPKILELRHYDGYVIPYKDNNFDVVTCIDVIEHVPDYKNLINEMLRVSKRSVFISTPNRRPENTRPDGRPKNRWHLREWSYEEFNAVLGKISGIRVEWNFINGDWDGPFEIGSCLSEDTMTLSPILLLTEEMGNE